MKIVVVSDSHGDFLRLGRIIEREKPFDMLIHCGDGALDPVRAGLPDGVTLVRVAGNMDRYNPVDLEEQIVVEAEGYKILVVHGDRYSVKGGVLELKSFFAGSSYDAVFFGHTHIKFYEPGKPVFLNPGPANKGCYAVVVPGKDRNSFEPELRSIFE